MTAGGPIQTVNPGDLRGVWELIHETRAKFVGNREAELGSPQPTISLDVKLLAQVCRPEANVLAVWARSGLARDLGAAGSADFMAAWHSA